MSLEWIKEHCPVTHPAAGKHGKCPVYADFLASAFIIATLTLSRFAAIAYIGMVIAQVSRMVYQSITVTGGITSMVTVLFKLAM